MLRFVHDWGILFTVKVTLLVVKALDAFSIRKALLRYQMVAAQVPVGNNTGLLVFDGDFIVHLLHLVGRNLASQLVQLLDDHRVGLGKAGLH